jgi:hypothetical protein
MAVFLFRDYIVQTSMMTACNHRRNKFAENKQQLLAALPDEAKARLETATSEPCDGMMGGVCERAAMSFAQSPRGCIIQPVNACLYLQHFENGLQSLMFLPKRWT